MTNLQVDKNIYEVISDEHPHYHEYCVQCACIDQLRTNIEHINSILGTSIRVIERGCEPWDVYDEAYGNENLSPESMPDIIYVDGEACVKSVEFNDPTRTLIGGNTKIPMFGYLHIWVTQSDLATICWNLDKPNDYVAIITPVNRKLREFLDEE